MESEQRVEWEQKEVGQIAVPFSHLVARDKSAMTK